MEDSANVVDQYKLAQLEFNINEDYVWNKFPLERDRYSVCVFIPKKEIQYGKKVVSELLKLFPESIQDYSTDIKTLSLRDLIPNDMEIVSGGSKSIFLDLSEIKSWDKMRNKVEIIDSNKYSLSVYCYDETPPPSFIYEYFSMLIFVEIELAKKYAETRLHRTFSNKVPVNGVILFDCSLEKNGLSIYNVSRN